MRLQYHWEPITPNGEHFHFHFSFFIANLPWRALRPFPPPNSCFISPCRNRIFKRITTCAISYILFIYTNVPSHFPRVFVIGSKFPSAMQNHKKKNSLQIKSNFLFAEAQKFHFLFNSSLQSNNTFMGGIVSDNFHLYEFFPIFCSTRFGKMCLFVFLI